ncbi:hypothetical protein LZ30DRAFT_312141 [Colletotrichum cereale]|nr:hypothetical protein LZ30DRAFT_312141 [Colletotrichum cereale]
MVIFFLKTSPLPFDEQQKERERERERLGTGPENREGLPTEVVLRRRINRQDADTHLSIHSFIHPFIHPSIRRPSKHPSCQARYLSKDTYGTTAVWPLVCIACMHINICCSKRGGVGKLAPVPARHTVFRRPPKTRFTRPSVVDEEHRGGEPPSPAGAVPLLTTRRLCDPKMDHLGYVQCLIMVLGWG